MMGCAILFGSAGPSREIAQIVRERVAQKKKKIVRERFVVHGTPGPGAEQW